MMGIYTILLFPSASEAPYGTVNEARQSGNVLPCGIRNAAGIINIKAWYL